MIRLLTLVSLTIAALAFAEEPAVDQPQAKLKEQATAAVQKGLLNPLKEKDARHSRFSRSRPPPTARRLRISDDAVARDAAGNSFVTFALDERRQSMVLDEEGELQTNWQRDTVVGCVYVESGKIFVKRADAFWPAEVTLGKKVKAVTDVCVTGQNSIAAAGDHAP